MLDQNGLTDALKQGQGQANICGHWCRAGAVLDDGRYIIHHNAVSSRSTDAQVIHAASVLGMNAGQLATRIRDWITGLHKGERSDLNASMATGGTGIVNEFRQLAEASKRAAEIIGATGGPVVTGSFYLVGECGPELFNPHWPAMNGWPWRPVSDDE